VYSSSIFCGAGGLGFAVLVVFVAAKEAAQASAMARIAARAEAGRVGI
jgi:hypothetical protein